jgi:serine/threonine-protein phosphatase 2A regulatory subunit A
MENLSTNIVIEYMLPLVLTLANDPIPNIRFNVAKALQDLTSFLVHAERSDLVETSIKPILIGLKNDQDIDVQYFSIKALQCIPIPNTVF